MISKTDAGGLTTGYVYSSLRRLTDIIRPDSSENVSYTYDTAGRLLSMIDGSGVSTYIHDDMGRLI